MQRWGNGRAKAYYEANVPRDYRTPTEHSSVREKEQWIREKYERKRFVSQDPPSEDDDRQRRKKQRDSEEEDGDAGDRRRSDRAERRRERERGSGSRHGSRTASREATPTVTPPQPAVTKDILSFDVFSEPVPVAKPAAVAPPPAAASQDEWASFGGSTNAQSGFANDAFAPAPAATEHVNKMANIMASFGPSATPQNAFPPQQGMAPAPMGMPMNGGMGGMNAMGMMPRPQMGMNMGMNMGMGMPGGQQQFMNPMMGQQQQQQPNMMMYPMQNQMYGAPQGGMMMNGNGFQGGAAPMGFQGQPMGMNPMGMQMNQAGFQQQQQQQQQQRPPQQQQQQVGGLNQSFVNFG
ncbi:hypothetical protein BBJ28_00015316 [Nothophytophthora sp. Chile5]|nr:hypothetical protein BBJ28_00015316 [Nothophytophthora sp. Chile5]